MFDPREKKTTSNGSWDILNKITAVTNKKLRKNLHVFKPPKCSKLFRLKLSTQRLAHLCRIRPACVINHKHVAGIPSFPILPGCRPHLAKISRVRKLTIINQGLETIRFQPPANHFQRGKLLQTNINESWESRMYSELFPKTRYV